MDNIIKFKKSAGDVLEYAEQCRNKGDYEGALSALIHESEKNGKDIDLLAHIADLYTELNLFDCAIVYWFRYLAVAQKKYLVDAYNGLGANFFFLGNKEIAGYYFNLQMAENSDEECFYEDVLEEYLNAILDARKDEYKVVYPLSKEEEQKIAYNEGSNHLEDKDYIAALESFDKVEKDSEHYLKAVLGKGECYYYLDKNEAAIEYLEIVANSDEVSVIALNLLINLLISVGEYDRAEEYKEQLKNLHCQDLSEKYKKLTALIDLGFIEEALALSDDMMAEFPYDVNVNYVRGLMFYNKGDYDRATISFRWAFHVSLSPIARYYLGVANKAKEGDIEYEKLGYSFDLPPNEIERRLDVVKNLFVQTKESIQNYDEEQLTQIAAWAFMGANQTLQVAVAVILSRAKLDEYNKILFKQLVNPMLSDDVKHRIISLLCENGKYGQMSVVYGNVFRKIDIPKPSLTLEGRDLFKKAYAYAVGRVSLLRCDELVKLSCAAEVLQIVVNSSGKMQEFEKKGEIAAIACAMYLSADLNCLGGSEELAYKFFDVSENSVKKIVALMQIFKNEENEGDEDEN